MKALSYILKSIGYKSNLNSWDAILKKELEYRKNYYNIYQTPVAQMLFNLPSDDDKLSNGLTFGELRKREKKRMDEHEEWLRKKAKKTREEDKKRKPYAGDKILDYPFIRDESGKVNLQAQGYNDSEGLAKFMFQTQSFGMLCAKGLIEDNIDQFNLMKYEEIMDLLEFAETMDNNPNALADAKLKFGENFQFYETKTEAVLLEELKELMEELSVDRHKLMKKEAEAMRPIPLGRKY